MEVLPDDSEIQMLQEFKRQVPLKGRLIVNNIFFEDYCSNSFDVQGGPASAPVIRVPEQ